MGSVTVQFSLVDLTEIHDVLQLIEERRNIDAALDPHHSFRMSFGRSLKPKAYEVSMLGPFLIVSAVQSATDVELARAPR